MTHTHTQKKHTQIMEKTLTCPKQKAPPVGIGTRGVLKKYHTSLTYSICQVEKWVGTHLLSTQTTFVGCFKKHTNTPAMLISLPEHGNITCYGVPAFMNFQCHMIACIDCVSQWQKVLFQPHDIYPEIAAKAQLSWSKKYQ